MSAKRLALLLSFSALLAACAPQPVPAPTMIPATATAVPAITPSAQATEAAQAASQPSAEVQSVPTTEQPAAKSPWIQYRDARYGIGVAYPCWWAFHPMPADGNGGAIGLRSFDEDYFRAHSVKGYWKDGIVPDGVFTADLVVFDPVDPAKSNVDAYPLDPGMNAIASSEDKVIGRNQATVIQIKDFINEKAPLTPVILFRPAPDKLLAFVTQQPDRLDSPDLQGILDSLSLSPDQPILVPTVEPHPPLINAACLSR